jgi:hypothetical protein
MKGALKEVINLCRALILGQQSLRETHFGSVVGHCFAATEFFAC